MAADSSDSAEPFVTAVLLARKGRYAEATKVLTRAHERGDCSEIESLDLQARIHAQQGQYLEAEECWRRAQELDHSNPAFAAGIARLRRTHRGTHRIYGAAAVVLVLALSSVAVWKLVVMNQQLLGRQAVLDGSVGALGRDLVNLQKTVQAQNRDLLVRTEALNDSLRGLDSQMRSGVLALQNSLQVQSHDLAKNMSTMGDSLRDLDSTLSQRFESMETATHTLDEHAAKVDTQLAAIANTIGQLDSEVAAVESHLDANTQDMTAVKRSISDMKKRLTGHVSAVQELKTGDRPHR